MPVVVLHRTLNIDAITTVTYVVQENTGVGTAGGIATCAVGANVDLYNDGVDILQLQMAADGTGSVVRTAGADTFNVRIWKVFL